MAESGYDLIASEYYDNGHITSRNFDEITKKALISVRLNVGNGLVLECGAGRGRAAEYLNLPSKQIVQLDASAEMLNLKEREDCLLQVHADACSIPLSSEQFCGVVGFLVDPFLGLDFLKEAHRVLQSDGELLLTTPTNEWGEKLRKSLGIDTMTTRFKVLGSENTVVLPSNLHSKDRLVEMLNHIGFKEVKVVGHSLTGDMNPISPDITNVIDNLEDKHTELPIIYVIRARK